MLKLPSTWTWDSWVVDDGERFHLFYLQAPMALGDPDLRHVNATVGHASSLNLTDWRIEPDALGPSESDWDDLAIWTGSVVRDGTGWRMFYTALGTRGHGVKDQRIGAAVSSDLTKWTRSDAGPAPAVDGRWYRTLNDDPNSSETWRDPFVLEDPDGDGWHMLITARVRGGQPNADGVLGHARSSDLTSWSLLPPLTQAAGFGQIEVPQVRRIDDTWVLVFTCHPDEQTPEQVARFGPHSTWSLTAEGPLGPWDLDDARPFEHDPLLFAAPLVQRRDGSWALLGFRNTESEGRQELWILDPVTVHVRHGHLAVG